MLKKLILLTVVAILISCSLNKKPEFLGVQNIKILEADRNFVKVSATASFKNPNDLGGKLQADGIKVLINDTETAILFSEEFEVPARELFEIPLTVEVPTDSILGEKSIVGLLGSLLSQKLKVQYQGPIKYKVVGFSHRYMIDKTEEVKIKF